MKEMFLDANAHLSMSKAAIDAFVKYNNSIAGCGHPMSPSKPGREASSALESARIKIASLLGAERSGQIFFTSTCTQACEWAVQILRNNTGTTYVSPIEHPAIRYVSEDFKMLNVSSDGVILPIETDNVICIHVQNEIGTIQPINDFKAKLLSDMCQSVGKVSINLKEMPVDIAVFGGHKFGGSAGVGFVYLKDINSWREFGHGSRYFSDRTGTPDVASVVATAAALEDTLMTMPERLEKMKEFQQIIEPELESLGCEVIGKNAERVPNTTFIKLPNSNSTEVLFDLSMVGIYVGLGSACGSMHAGQTPLMKALGRDGNASDFLRISQHGDYGKDEALLFIEQIKKIL